MQAFKTPQDGQFEDRVKSQEGSVEISDTLYPQNSDVPVPGRMRSIFSNFSLAATVSFALVIWYAIAFVKSLKGRWFNPAWTTDDATQQTYPLYEAIYPGIFQDDLVSEVMRGCLPPLHYGISYAITLFTQNPIMTGHWVMLIQLSLALAALFMAVRRFSGSSVPAALAVVWLMHSRNTMQRITGGLPRGWTPAIFGTFFYFVATRNHWGALATILVGSMLNPPGALIVGVAYGLIMLFRWRSSNGVERQVARSRVFQAMAVAPLLLVVALAVVQRPAHIGQMVSFEEASKMPEFSRPYGRFPFLPLTPASKEIDIYGYQAFIGRLYRPTEFWRQNIWWMVPVSLVGILLIGARRKIMAVPAEILCFGLAASMTYALARQFAFKLFVPDRHLQIPMVFFMICAFTIGLWRIFSGRRDESLPSNSLRRSWPALLAFSGLGFVVFQCSHLGLSGDANFNYSTKMRGYVYQWLRTHTPQEAVVACHPNHCNGVQLLAVRRAFVATETSHPFYPRYNLEMRRRSEVSLRAHYAESLEEVASLLIPEGITHFVFRKADFRPTSLSKMTYHPPLDKVVKELIGRPSGVFAFNALPKQMDPQNYPFVKFIDGVSVVIDVKELGDYLRARGWSEPQASIGASMRRHARTKGMLVASGTVDQVGLPS